MSLTLVRGALGFPQQIKELAMAMIEKGYGKIELLCDGNLKGQAAPIAFCRCPACKEARNIHRYKRATIVEATDEEQILRNIAHANAQRAKRRALREAQIEAAHRAAQPFNAIKVR